MDSRGEVGVKVTKFELVHTAVQMMSGPKGDSLDHESDNVNDQRELVQGHADVKIASSMQWRLV